MRAGGWAIRSWAMWSVVRCCCIWWTARRRMWSADYETIIAELDAYGGGLADKPRVTVLNKIDALDR
jgi:GTPase involved in cell partitioning and DNA repair